MLIALYHTLSGTVKVRLKGAYIPRFLSACAQEGLAPFRISAVAEDVREDGTALRRGDCLAEFTVADFALLAPLARKTHTRVHVLRRRGAFFFLRPLRYRWGFFLGVLLLLAALYGATGYIWTVDVTGCQSVRPAQVLRLLEENGVHPGIRPDSYSPDHLRNQILPKLHAVAWLSVRRYGCRLVVHVYERATAQAAQNGRVCDLVAAQSGYVTLVEITGGTPAVETDQLVEAGQTLAYGVMAYPEYSDGTEKSYPVPANGRVMARVWDTVRVVQPLESAEKVYTGRSRTRWALTLGNLRLTLGDAKDPYAHCTMETRTYTASFGADYTLPLRLTRTTYREYERALTGAGTEALREALRKAGTESLRAYCAGRRITVLNEKSGVQNQAVWAEITVESMRNIAEPVFADPVS